MLKEPKITSGKEGEITSREYFELLVSDEYQLTDNTRLNNFEWSE